MCISVIHIVSFGQPCCINRYCSAAVAMKLNQVQDLNSDHRMWMKLALDRDTGL